MFWFNTGLSGRVGLGNFTVNVTTLVTCFVIASLCFCADATCLGENAAHVEVSGCSVSDYVYKG